MRDINTLLIANRGEIALRIIRTARAMGLRTIAVYSDADEGAPYGRAADDAVHIGPASSSESYLRIEAILEAAQVTGADAIHPGYGFLAENAAFARAVEAAGLVFIGPSADAIEIMGDKAHAKRHMIAAGVPCVPGYEGEDQDEARFVEAARAIGFPVMVKAAAGGGGRGMRLVAAADDLKPALDQARSEAERAFGSGDLILEKAIIRPRHVEVQIFADTHGTVIHLGERDCSVQRRHQKVIEEAPCPVLTPSQRAAMGAAAVEAARAVAYCGAGTVEFLRDEAGDFYFLEMNTRLQVEHPVTELVTGLDLVALQIDIARGAALPLAQEDVTLNGHAIEVRLYAEDPEHDFLPSTGEVDLWSPPSGNGVRVDDGLESGGVISSFYDPMAAKIMAHGATREEARQRLLRALEQTALFGPKSNRDFLIDVLRQPVFARGEATTAFIAETYGEAGFEGEPVTPGHLAAAAVLHHCVARDQARHAALCMHDELLDWSPGTGQSSIVQYALDEENIVLSIHPLGNGAYHVTAADWHCDLTVQHRTDSQARLYVDGRRVSVIYHHRPDGRLYLTFPARTLVMDNLVGRQAGDGEASGSGAVMAPMHGRLLTIDAAPGQSVAKGERLAVLEAMKMQHEILAPVTGTIIAVPAESGAQIAAGDMIVEIDPKPDT